MNTPAHLIIGAAVFAKPERYRLNIAALIGALVPDASLYFMVFWNRNVRGMSFEQIFGTEYFSDFWQQVFAIDNSIPLWGSLWPLPLPCAHRFFWLLRAPGCCICYSICLCTMTMGGCISGRSATGST